MLNFYNIDQKYISYLQNIDNKVPNIGYGLHDKFVCGIVLNINGCDYYAPISSNKTVFRTSFPIKNQGKVISTIRFSFMFPAIQSALTMINFKQIAATDKNYASLLQTEWRYCIANQDKIMQKAKKIYAIGTNPRHIFNNVCCDFLKLEQAAIKYNTIL